MAARRARRSPTESAPRGKTLTPSWIAALCATLERELPVDVEAVTVRRDAAGALDTIEVVRAARRATPDVVDTVAALTGRPDFHGDAVISKYAGGTTMLRIRQTFKAPRPARRPAPSQEAR